MSTLLSLNGQTVTGSIHIPAVGATIVQFTGNPEFQVPQTGNVVQFGEISFTCAKVRAEQWQGSTIGKLIVGSGGWGKVLSPKFYRLPAGVKLSLILGDAAREVGETIDVSPDRVLGPFYVRENFPAQTLLNRLCVDWYISPDGVTHTGPRAGGTVSSRFDVIDNDPSFSRVVVATDAPLDWVPGRTFSNGYIPTRTIDSVTHIIQGTTCRTEVLCV